MHKRLYRSRNDKMIAGICGGIAEYFNIDPVIVRVIAFILLLPGALPGFIPYLILWAIIPKAPQNPPTTSSGDDSRSGGSTGGPILDRK